MHIVVRVLFGILPLRSLEVLALSTNSGVCFGELVADAVILFGGGLPWLVELPIKSAL